MTTIPIPPTVYVPCPAISFRNRRAERCLSCSHFQGVVDTMPAAQTDEPFERRYRIGCAHIVARRCIAIEGEPA